MINDVICDCSSLPDRSHPHLLFPPPPPHSPSIERLKRIVHMPTVPREITGSIGSRIRIVFGDTGDDWLLLLNNDDGDRKWQSKAWSGNIPYKIAKQLNNCDAKGRKATCVDFGPGGEWYVHGVKPDGTGAHHWWGGTFGGNDIEEMTGSIKVSFGSDDFGQETYAIIQGRNGYSLSGSAPSGLRDRLDKIHRKRKNVEYVRLFSDGKYYISDDEGSQWFLNNKHLEDEVRKNGYVHEVAVAGDGSWAVVKDNSYESSFGVCKELEDKLSNFFSDQRRWIKDRKREIREEKNRQERERLAREQAAREAEERERREAVERAARVREEAERAERERIQQEAREAARLERERVEREAIEAAELNAASRISSLESMLESHLEAEAKDIKDMEANLLRRKRSFRETMQSMPSDVQSRISVGNNNEEKNATSNSENICVVCHDEPAVMAVVPCGHQCLCNSCSNICIEGQASARQCPLCRGNMQSILRIYLGR